jgi:hypothetical protein
MATSEKTSSYRWVIEVLLVLALASQARGCPWALKPFVQNPKSEMPLAAEVYSVGISVYGPSPCAKGVSSVMTGFRLHPYIRPL